MSTDIRHLRREAVYLQTRVTLLELTVIGSISTEEFINLSSMLKSPDPELKKLARNTIYEIKNKV